MNNEIKSNSIVFAGPFMGEFGWELSHWSPHTRWLRNQYQGKRMIISSYPGREPLYQGIADEFWQLPDWFVSKKYDLDCFEALSLDCHYEKLILHFGDKLKKRFPKNEVLWTKTPRGFNHILRNMNQVVFQKLKASPEADKVVSELISNHGNKPIIIFFARNVNRKMFLDIKNNIPAFVEDHYPNWLPTRNWPRSYWHDLFKMLYTRFGNKFTFAIGGTKDGNCLLQIAQDNPEVIDLTILPNSLDITIALLNKAFLSISSQGGPTHLSVQCGCPSFIYGHEEERHAKTDNPLRTDVVFLSTQLGLYNDPPELLFKEISVYINLLMKDKKIQDGPIQEHIALDNNLAYWEQRYKAMAAEKVVGHRDWTDQQYKDELNIWTSKLQPFLDYPLKAGIVKVLDFGCGIGRFEPFLSKCGDSYFGCDIILSDPISDDRLSIIMDHQIPFENTKFDLIFSCVTLQHVIDANLLEYYLNQFYKRLNSDGFVLITENILNAPSNNYLAFRSRDKYIEMFNSAGFELVKEDVFESSNEPHAILLFKKRQKKKIKKIGMVGVSDIPGSTSIPFGKAFISAGYQIDTFDYRTIAKEIGWDATNKEIVRSSAEYDLIIFCKANGITPDAIRACSKNALTCWYMQDAKMHLDNDSTYYDMARAADLNIIATGEVVNALKNAGIKEVHHIIQGIDPNQFHPIENEKICDIVFIGQCTQKRLNILNNLSTSGITGRAYGPGFPAGFCDSEKFNLVCSEGRILLAINNTDSNQDSFSDRILRYMATGGCVVTEYSRGLEKYFVNGKHLAWPHEPDTLVDVIKKSLDHPKMMKQMAENGYRHVLENHTWDSVVKQIIEIANNL